MGEAGCNKILFTVVLSGEEMTSRFAKRLAIGSLSPIGGEG
jgi:hypothetical protein